MTGLRRRLVGALAAATVLGIVVGLPATLLAVGGNLPHSVPSTGAITSALTSPDDGTLALGFIHVVGWTVWILLTGSILLEVSARIRRVRTPGLPGLGVPQLTAHHLVSAAMMLFIAAPLITQTASPTFAEPTSAVVQTISGDQQRPVRAAKQPHDEAPAATVSHTVRRGESLWSIARDHLGSGTRYPAIAHLNKRVLGGRPNFLIPGTVLQLPKPDIEQDQPGRRYRVRRGDTLSGIAEQQLDDANRYPAIFDASRRIIQPGGVHLSDPDIIDVGWTLTIPVKQTARANAPEGSDARTGHNPGKEPTRQAEGDNPAPSTASPTHRPSATVTPQPTSTPSAATPTASSTTRAGQQPADPHTTTADNPRDELLTPPWLL
jgi:LysM repeat protein